MTHSVVLEVTQRLTERSREARAAFLARTEVQAEAGKGRIGEPIFIRWPVCVPGVMLYSWSPKSYPIGASGASM